MRSNLNVAAMEQADGLIPDEIRIPWRFREAARAGGTIIQGTQRRIAGGVISPRRRSPNLRRVGGGQIVSRDGYHNRRFATLSSWIMVPRRKHEDKRSFYRLRADWRLLLDGPSVYMVRVLSIHFVERRYAWAQ